MFVKRAPDGSKKSLKGLVFWNLKTLAQKILLRSTILKIIRSNSKVIHVDHKVQNVGTTRKVLSQRMHTHVKHENPITYHSKVMSIVKSFGQMDRKETICLPISNKGA